MPTQTFKVGEMLNKRTPNSKTWMNFDGSYTTEIHSGLVHFADENGNYQNINTDLFDEADFDLIDEPVASEGKERFYALKEKAKADKKKNKLNRDNFDYQGLKVPFDVKLPRNFKKGYTIGKGANKLTFKPIGASPAKGYVEETKGNCIHYQDAWNDADVCLELSPSGVKETIILKTDRAPLSFSFEVDGELEEDLTSGKLKLEPAWLQDANGEKRDVEQTVRREGDQTFVDITANVEGLTYPIEIDPTVTIQPDANAGKDAIINSLGSGASTNYGSDVSHFLGGNNEGSIYRGLIQFDLSLIPTGAFIEEASLYFTTFLNYGTQLDLDMHNIVSNWDESTVTWNTMPNFETSVINSVPSLSSGSTGIIKFDLKTSVQEIVKGQRVNYGWLNKSRIEPTSGDNRKIARSSDFTSYQERPKLTIKYNQPPTAPTVLTPNGGETWNSLHTVSWNASTDTNNLDIIWKSFDQTWSNLNYYSGQTVTIPSGVTKLNSFSFLMDSYSAGTSVLLEVANSSYQTLYSKQTSFAVNGSANGQEVKHVLDTPISVTPGQKIIIFFKKVSSEYSIKYHRTGNYSGGNLIYDNGSIVSDIAADICLSLEFSTSGNELQYNIQLTTDNGVTWKDIVPLTNSGVTSYDYDFINEAESSTSKIRIRAYDGSAYGEWDQSDGVFTIQHNQAPTAPTNLSPSGTVKDRASVIRLSWQHNDTNADPQAQFDLQWRFQGTTAWNTVSQATVNQYYDVPANTFPKGVIEWQVRTYDQAGLSSPYSTVTVFNTGDKPSTPTITAPTNGEVVPVSNPTVQWSSVGQVAYHLKVLDINNNLLWETSPTSTNKAQTVQYALENETDYKIQLAIKNADGLWSDFTTHSIYVSYTPPAKPILSTTKDEERASITINVSNPTPVYPQPTVVSADVYKRKQGGEWIRIKIGITDSYTDYTPASSQVYEYRVRVFGDNETFTDSDVISNSVTVKNAQISMLSNFSNYVVMKYNTDRDESFSRERVVSHFAGRKSPIVEFGDNRNKDIGLTFTIKDRTDLEVLYELADCGENLLYRDSRGRRVFMSISDIKIKDEFMNMYSLNIPMTEVSYVEEV